MHPIAVLIRNIFVLLWTLLRNLFKVIGLRPARPDWVALDLRDDPPYRPFPRRQRLAAAMTGRHLPLDLQSLSKQVDRVSRTRRVRGVLLRVDGLSTSLAKIASLAAMLEKLRAAGKEVLVWTPHATSREAPLLFGGDRLFLCPAGRLEMQGFAVQATSAAPALDWMGVGVTVIRRGRYKTAAETFSNERMSDALRETLDAILDDLYRVSRDALAGGRGFSDEDAEKALAKSPWTGRGALSAGVVDGVCYWDELVESIEQGEKDPAAAGSRVSGAQDDEEEPKRRRVAKVAPYPSLSASRLSPIDWKPVLAARRAIAVIPMKGLIVEGDSRQILGSSVTGHRTLSETLSKVGRMPWIKAIVLHIESRGGSALASDLIWRELRRVAKKKPVVAFIDTVAASGGYYCASAARSIVASPLCLTGSIGVITVLLEMSRLTSRLGIKQELVQRGERAAVGTSVRPPTEDELSSLEADVDTYYDLFLDRVAEGRPLSREEVEERAEGRVFTGKKARELSLVDELGDLETAVRKAKSLAGMDPKRPAPLVTIETASGPFGAGGHAGRAAAPGEALLTGTLTGLGLDGFDIAWLGSMAQGPREAWAVLPYRLV